MKKLSLLFCFLCITFVSYADPIDVLFSVEVVGTGTPLNPLPKSPINPPQATLDGHVLTFTTSHADFVLTLLDEDGDEVYTVFVPAATTTVVLPSTLTGLFELQLYPGGSYYFSGDIVL